MQWHPLQFPPVNNKNYMVHGVVGVVESCVRVEGDGRVGSVVNVVQADEGGKCETGVVSRRALWGLPGL